MSLLGRRSRLIIGRWLSRGSDQQYSTHNLTSLVVPKPRLNYRDIVEKAIYKSHNAFNRKASLPLGAIQNIAKLWQAQKDISGMLNAKRNERSTVGERIRRLNLSRAEEKAEALKEAKELKTQVAELEVRLAEVEEKLFDLALTLPNDTHPLSPIGSENAAVTLSTHGPHPIPASPERDHLKICRALNLLDLEAGVIAAGSSWYYLKNEGALLEMALANYALSIAIEHGFTPIVTPDVVRTDIAMRCGFHPRDHPDSPPTQIYHIAQSNSPSQSVPHPELVLSGTAEIPLAALFANKILPHESMPSKVVGIGKAYRAEAGARGSDTKGLYRVHHFTKIELFAIAPEDCSEEMLEEIRRVQVKTFEGLGIPFRVQDMPTEELGASAYRKYDMEAWMPGRGQWGEISSTSNCTDYQSRRLHIRYRPPPDLATFPAPSPLPFAHTLNGTAAAIPRLIIALLENGVRFNKEGAIVGLDLPDVLKPFWLGGKNIIDWVNR